MQSGKEGSWEVFFLPEMALRSLKTARGSERGDRLEQVAWQVADLALEMTEDCTNVLPPQRGGAVPSPMGMGRNGRTDLPRGSTERSPPLSVTLSITLPTCLAHTKLGYF